MVLPQMGLTDGVDAQPLKVRYDKNGDVAKYIVRTGNQVLKRIPNVEKEYEVLRIINEVSPDLRVPKALYYKEGVFAMSALPGEHLNLKMGEYGQIQNHIAAMADCLAELHSTDTTKLRPLLETKFSSLKNNIETRFQQHLSINNLSCNQSPYKDDLIWLSDKSDCLPGNCQLRLIHGDYCHPQALIHKGFASTFDFETAFIGFVEDDLARFVTKLQLAGIFNIWNPDFYDDLVDCFLERYNSHIRYDDLAYSLLKYAYAFRVSLIRKDTGSVKTRIRNEIIRLAQKRMLKKYRRLIKAKVNEIFKEKRTSKRSQLVGR